jgi:hypothetical protein
MGRRQGGPSRTGGRSGVYLNRYVTDEQRSRRPEFLATLRAAAGWRFFGVARSLRINLDMLVAPRIPTRNTSCNDVGGATRSDAGGFRIAPCTGRPGKTTRRAGLTVWYSAKTETKKRALRPDHLTAMGFRRLADHLELRLIGMVFRNLALILFRRTSVRAIGNNPAIFIGSELSIIDR